MRIYILLLFQLFDVFDSQKTVRPMMLQHRDHGGAFTSRGVASHPITHDTLTASRTVLTAALCTAVALAPSSAGGQSAKAVFAGVSGGIVVVTALDAGGRQTSQGSGVVIGANEVATNCHVVADATTIAVRQAADTRGRETYRMPATLTARNEERDLCLLFVQELSEPPAATPVPLGSAREVSIGEEVYAIGAPRGLELSLSRGIVSQLRGDYGKRSAPTIQTDAAISPGSSGGGLFNQAGQLIGITTYKMAGDASEGLSFAVPVEWVKDLHVQAEANIAAARQQEACFSSPTVQCLIAAARTASGLLVYALEAIAKAQAATGNFEAARRTAERIDWGLHQVDVLSAIAKAQAKGGDREGAKSTLATARRTAESILDVRDRVSALRAIAKAQAKGGNIKAAWATTEDIDTTWVRVSALSAIAEAQAKGGDIAAAKHTFAIAQRTTESIPEADNRVRALRAIAEAQAKAGDITGTRTTLANAARFAERIDKARIRVEALSATAEAQAKGGPTHRRSIRCHCRGAGQGSTSKRHGPPPRTSMSLFEPSHWRPLLPRHRPQQATSKQPGVPPSASTTSFTTFFEPAHWRPLPRRRPRVATSKRPGVLPSASTTRDCIESSH